MIKLTHLVLAAAVPAFTVWCTSPDAGTQAELREGTVTIEGHRTVTDHEAYPFIHEALNVIDMNGNSWQPLLEKLAKSDTSKFSIVHIGVSHIQADVSTGRTREHFRQRFGNGGRGLIAPFKIAGTNEPSSYHFTTTANSNSAKLMTMPWRTDMGFTGTAFTPRSLKYSVTLSTEVARRPEGDPYDRIRLFANGKIYVDRITDGENLEVKFSAADGEDYTDIILERPATNTRLSLHSFEPVTIFGASLTSGDKGVRYHSIGNNGATFSSYNRLGSMGHDVKALDPDLIILSMGTNEAFGTFTPEAIEAEIDYMVKDLLRNNPGVKILLTTPKECQRAVRTRRRRRSVATGQYKVNDKVKLMRDAIIDYGNRHGIPVYDWYTVAGGDGASDKWLENGLLGKDRIHNTYAGYELAGDMLYDALMQAIISSNSDTLQK